MTTQKKEKRKMETADVLSIMLKHYQADFVNSFNKQFFGDLILTKPEKYFYEPLFTIRIPYLYFDQEYDEYGDGRKGLFMGYKEIPIGKKKVINKNYQEEMKKWKNRPKPKTITFSRFTNLQSNHEK